MKKSNLERSMLTSFCSADAIEIHIIAWKRQKKNKLWVCLGIRQVLFRKDEHMTIRIEIDDSNQNLISAEIQYDNVGKSDTDNVLLHSNVLIKFFPLQINVIYLKTNVCIGSLNNLSLLHFDYVDYHQTKARPLQPLYSRNFTQIKLF